MDLWVPSLYQIRTRQYLIALVPYITTGNPKISTRRRPLSYSMSTEPMITLILGVLQAVIGILALWQRRWHFISSCTKWQLPTGAWVLSNHSANKIWCSAEATGYSSMTTRQFSVHRKRLWRLWQGGLQQTAQLECPKTAALLLHPIRFTTTAPSLFNPRKQPGPMTWHCMLLCHTLWQPGHTFGRRVPYFVTARPHFWKKCTTLFDNLLKDRLFFKRPDALSPLKRVFARLVFFKS